MTEKPHSTRDDFEQIRHWLSGGLRAMDGPVTQEPFEALRRIEEQLEAMRDVLRGVFVWVEVPDSSMGDADWRKREEAMREAQRILTSNPASKLPDGWRSGMTHPEPWNA